MNKDKKHMKNIHPLFNQERQSLARRYEKEKRLIGLVGMMVTVCVLLIFYFSGMSRNLADLTMGRSIIWPFLVYAAVFYTFLFVCRFPLLFFAGYVHEHRWHFSNQTIRSWLWEQAKSVVVGLVLFSLILGLLLWIMDRFPQIWWLIAALVMTVVSVVFATLYPVVIAPLFNTYVPIHHKRLTETLNRILAQGGLKSSGFFREDMSRQTKKENAFLAGLGKTRRVILGDNLMENMTVPEIESIIAHEVGHYKYKHIWKNILIGTLQSLVIFFLANLLMGEIFPLFLSSTRWNMTFFPVLVLIAGGLSFFIFGLLNNTLSRSFEKQADRYALWAIENKTPFMTALVGLADRNLSNAYPEWWIKLLYYSHPPAGERIHTAEKYQNERR